MRKLLITLGFIVMLATAFMAGILVGIKYQQEQIPTIREFQKRVGAVVDGELGNETESKWKQAYYDKYGIWPY